MGKVLPIIALCLATVIGWSHGYFTNPVLDVTSADPYIYKHTDGLYYYVKSEDDGIVVMKNDILTDWRNPLERQKVYQMPPGKFNLWAPEIHYINSVWYIYFTMGTKVHPTPTQRMHVIQALNDNPLGAYGHAIRLEPPAEDYYQIDGTVIEYPPRSGNRYMMWSGCQEDGRHNPTDLYIAPMRSPTELGGNRTLLRTRTQPWEGTVLEGPQVIWNHDESRLFIIFSANDYQNANYCLGMMSIENWANPLIPSNWWNDLSGPVFYQNPEEGVYGPGHASFTFSPNDEEGWIVYHAMQVPQMPPDHDNRTTRVEQYTWEDGIPKFPRPSGLGTNIDVPGGQPDNIHHQQTD